MSVIDNSLLLTAPAGGSSYQVSRSLRFNSGDSAYLNRTPASAGNRKTWTWAGWVKRSGLGGAQVMFSSVSGFNDATVFRFGSDQIDFYNFVSGGYQGRRTTSAVYRDASAWYHIVLAWDSANGTVANRIRLYVNGVEVTAFGTTGDPNSADSYINSTNAHFLGSDFGFNNQYLSACLADVHFIDGQALDPSSFTEVSVTTGQLIPKAYTGSYGTNGFRLAFDSYATTAALGTDTSGNGNTWTVNNFSVSSGAAVSVAAATGALPVFNTTDTYGTVKGTGTRTDTNSSSIVLALPMDGTNGGTSFGDQSAVIKGSGSAKTINVNGNTNTSTSQSKFYGSSGYFDGSGDFLTSTSADFGFSSGTAFTIECWFRAAGLPSSGDGSGGAIFGNRGFVESNAFTVYLGSSSTNTIGVHVGGGTTTYFSRSGGFALNTWYHLAMVRNTSNTVEFYVNGISIGTGSVTGDLSNGEMYIAAWNSGAAFNGYMQDLRIYKGAAKYTGNFNPPSATADPAVGAGNDSLVDTPTSYGTDAGAGGEVRGNYCTWNPLSRPSSATLSNGNLDATYGTSSYPHLGSDGTIQYPTSGKWYYEVSVVTVGELMVGFRNVVSGAQTRYYRDNSGGFNNIGIEVTASAGQYSVVGYTNGDVIGVALNCDALTAAFYKNGTQVGSTYSLTTVSNLVPFVTHSSSGGGAVATANFGQRAFAYTAPSGFKALVDTNLPTPVVAKSNTVMDVKLYTGNAGDQTISGLSFSPDFIWTKSRSQAYSHNVYDSIRGTGKNLFANETSAENTDANTIKAFNSNGFQLGSNDNGNYTNGGSAVAWCWDGGTTTVTNTAGSITSSVRANASAGFSVVTYTGTGSSGTIGHGLGVKPKVVLIKNRDAAADWGFYYDFVDGTMDRLLLNTTDAKTDQAVSAPTSTVFSTAGGSGDGANGQKYVAYVFSSVVGYSSFGSITGNGSSDGPFAYCGFRPRWILMKQNVAGENWIIFDTARDTYNVAGLNLFPNLSNSENDYRSYSPCDILSNGFKLRTSNVTWNTSGAQILYAAFAESPFQYARAR